MPRYVFGVAGVISMIFTLTLHIRTPPRWIAFAVVPLWILLVMLPSLKAAIRVPLSLFCFITGATCSAYGLIAYGGHIWAGYTAAFAMTCLIFVIPSAWTYELQKLP